jgi:hypothetical protein
LKDNLFLFLEDSTIPTRNNSSEKAFRISKIFMKVTNWFCFDWGKELLDGVCSVTNIGKHQGLNAYQATISAIPPQSLHRFTPGTGISEGFDLIRYSFTISTQTASSRSMLTITHT